MLNAVRRDSSENASHTYHMLRAALETYQRNLADLQPSELDRVRAVASKSYEIESLVLASDEATDVIVPGADVDRAFAEVAARYADSDELFDDLHRNGLDEAALRESLRRELLFDSVMQRVGARHARVNDIDVRLFYEMHRERFSQPEKRSARHILMTINPDYVENTAIAARTRMDEIAAKLKKRSNRFASLARRHSECPTALDGGKLGVVARGQLYPELDAALFNLREGGISDVVETEVGLHIVMCEKIEPQRDIPLSKAWDGIIDVLANRKRRNCQKAWLGELRRAADSREVS